MHEAYEVSHLLNATFQIETIAAYGKHARYLIIVSVHSKHPQ